MRAPLSFWKPSVAVFDPATLALSGWWRADYSGSAPWAANASAGASLANGDLVHEGADPSSGATQNGRTPASFNGSNQDLQNATLDTTFYTSTAGGIICIFNGATVTNATGNTYDDATIVRNVNSNTGLSFTLNLGVSVYAYDGAYQSVSSTTPLDNAYHIVMGRWNGSTLGLTVDSAAESTTACGTVTLGGDAMSVGAGYGLIRYFQGNVLDLMLFAYTPSATDFANVKSYCNSRYALSL